MKRFTLLVVVVAAMALSAGAASPAFAAGKSKTKSFKCWTNKDGVRECGESVPPEYSQEGHEVLNKQGMVVKETEAAKSEEELKADAEQKAKEAEQKKMEAEKKRQDEILLATYTSVDDIERVRDEQLQALDVAIKSTEGRNVKIKADLDKRIAAAAGEERSGKKPNDAMLKDIESLRRQIGNNEEFIKQKKEEQDSIKAEYAGKVERFKELRSIKD